MTLTMSSQSPSTVAAVEELRSASEVLRERSRANTSEPGLARRQLKLSRQLAAAATLLERGSEEYLSLPTVTQLRSAAGAAELWSVDMWVHRARTVVTALHGWRGHTDCVPASASD